MKITIVVFELCLEISYGLKTEEKGKSAWDDIFNDRKKEVTGRENRLKWTSEE